MATPDDDLFEKLSREADERLDATEPEGWGEVIDLAEGEKFLGRYLDEQVSPETNRAVFLLLAPDEGVSLAKSTLPVYIRERAMLRSEMDRARPANGDYIVIARGKDRQGKDNEYHSYAVAVAPCPQPLPEGVSGGGKTTDDDIPFAPAAA